MGCEISCPEIKCGVCPCFRDWCCPKEVKEEDPKAETSLTVEQQLYADQIKNLFKFKVLLLGAGESGKSTIVKQLKYIYKKKATDQELNLVAISLHQNLVDCFKAMFYAVKIFKTHTLSPKGQELERTLHQRDDSERLLPDEGKLIEEVWNNDGAIKNAYSRRSEFWLLDSFVYYIEHVGRFCSPNFRPSEDDSIMARIRTTGIVQTELEHRIASNHPDEPTHLTFLVVDVGGQRNERKKWLHCFDDVVGILFIVSLAGYNQVLFEDTRKNRMHESLELFEKITNNMLFADTPIFLFLNKKDLFEKMVLESDMKSAFPEYTGGLENKAALDFIQKEFSSRMPPTKNMEEIQVVSARLRFEIKGGFDHVKKSLYDSKRDDLLASVGKLKKEAKVLSKQNDGSSCCACCV